MSNNVIDKRLAFGRDWSSTVVNSGRQERSEIPAPPARWPRWGWWCGETPRPDIPTVDEAALPGLYASPWFSLGTQRHAAACESTAQCPGRGGLADAVVRKRLAETGNEISTSAKSDFL
jgi:hypothetical protein